MSLSWGSDLQVTAPGNIAMGDLGFDLVEKMDGVFMIRRYGVICLKICLAEGPHDLANGNR
jgi:hypothetical protein